MTRSFCVGPLFAFLHGRASPFGRWNMVETGRAARSFGFFGRACWVMWTIFPHATFDFHDVFLVRPISRSRQFSWYREDIWDCGRLHSHVESSSLYVDSPPLTVPQSLGANPCRMHLCAGAGGVELWGGRRWLWVWTGRRWRRGVLTVSTVS